MRVLAGVVLITSGCSTWAVSTAPLPGIIAAHNEIRVRQTLDREVLLFDPLLQGDTLVGLRSRSMAPGGTVAIPRSTIVWVEVRRISAGRTAFLVLGLAATALAAAGLAATANWSSNWGM